MTKIAANAADAFVRKPDPKAIAILVYGPDRGLVRERVRVLVDAAIGGDADPFRFVEVEGDVLEADPARIADEAASMSLTGAGRLVLVKGGGGQKLADAFKAVIAGGRSEALFVVEAGDLPPKSPLRKAFETGAAAAAVPCYVDDAEALSGLASRLVREAGLQIDRAALDDLAARLGSDRLVSRSEIEKLILFKGAGGGTITAEDVEQAVGDAAAVSLDDVVFAAASGNGARLDAALQRAFREGVAPTGVMRAAGRHLTRLQLAAAAHAQGMPPAQAIQRLRPPVFFKYKNEFIAQLQRWTPARLARALQIVTAAERDCKTTGFPDEAVCERALIRIAAAARASA